MSVSLPIEILERFKGDHEVFFETGTSEGDSVQTAIDAGFSEIYTVELDQPTFNRASNRFKDLPNVHVMNGLSIDIMRRMIHRINEPILFFLDAHPDCGISCTPVMDELEEISKRSYQDTIIIDDMRLMGRGKWESVTVDRISKFIQSINTFYKITREKNGHDDQDLLVARIEEIR